MGGGRFGPQVPWSPISRNLCISPYIKFKTWPKSTFNSIKGIPQLSGFESEVSYLQVVGLWGKHITSLISGFLFVTWIL